MASATRRHSQLPRRRQARLQHHSRSGSFLHAGSDTVGLDVGDDRGEVAGMGLVKTQVRATSLFCRAREASLRSDGEILVAHVVGCAIGWGAEGGADQVNRMSSRNCSSSRPGPMTVSKSSPPKSNSTVPRAFCRPKWAGT